MSGDFYAGMFIGFAFGCILMAVCISIQVNDDKKGPKL